MPFIKYILLKNTTSYLVFIMILKVQNYCLVLSVKKPKVFIIAKNTERKLHLYTHKIT